MMKVFCAGDSPRRKIWETICLVAGELYGLGNDSYCPWSIGADAGGYAPIEDVKEVDAWLLKQDPSLTTEEEILIFISW